MREALKTLRMALVAPPISGLILAIASLVILGVKLRYFDNIPEWFGHADEYGHLLQDILVATVAAYIFFLITVQLPAVQEKRDLGPSIAILVSSIVTNAVRFLHQANFELNKKDNTASLPSPVTREFVAALFKRLPTNGEPTIPNHDIKVNPIKKLTWIQVLAAQNTLCLEHIEDLLRYSRFLEAELVAQLNALRFSRMTRGMNTIRDLSPDPTVMYLSNPDLSVFADEYFEYYGHALELQGYWEQFRNRYGIRV